MRLAAIQDLWPAVAAFLQRLLQEPIQALAVVVALVIIVVALTLALTRRYARWMGWWRRRRGLQAEGAAGKFLEQEGFEILDETPRLEYQLLIDGRLRSFSMTPDLVVTRDGCDYLVEVKRKDHPISINNAGVRRQVLEYMVAGGLPCLLVDMHAREITTVSLDRFGD